MTTKAVAYIFPPQTWIQVGGMDEGAESGHLVSHLEGSQETQMAGLLECSDLAPSKGSRSPSKRATFWHKCVTRKVPRRPKWLGSLNVLIWPFQRFKEPKQKMNFLAQVPPMCSKLDGLGAHSGHIVRHRNHIVMNSLRALSLNE